MTTDARTARHVAIVYSIGLGGGGLAAALIPWWAVVVFAVLGGAVLLAEDMKRSTRPAALRAHLDAEWWEREGCPATAAVLREGLLDEPRPGLRAAIARDTPAWTPVGAPKRPPFLIGHDCERDGCYSGPRHSARKKARRSAPMPPDAMRRALESFPRATVIGVNSYALSVSCVCGRTAHRASVDTVEWAAPFGHTQVAHTMFRCPHRHELIRIEVSA